MKKLILGLDCFGISTVSRAYECCDTQRSSGATGYHNAVEVRPRKWLSSKWGCSIGMVATGAGHDANGSTRALLNLMVQPDCAKGLSIGGLADY
jgi:hypothetical protein